MWRYEGSRTLAHYLRRRDCLRALAEDMDVPVEAVPAVVMKQLLQGLTVSEGKVVVEGVRLVCAHMWVCLRW